MAHFNLKISSIVNIWVFFSCKSTTQDEFVRYVYWLRSVFCFLFLDRMLIQCFCLCLTSTYRSSLHLNRFHLISQNVFVTMHTLTVLILNIEFIKYNMVYLHTQYWYMYFISFIFMNIIWRIRTSYDERENPCHKLLDLESF